jgi:5'-deoxynucleotidase YfbR-like HD superfamily hydrolase
MKPEISLYSGGNFCFTEPDSSNYTVKDIALNLSNLSRFTGSLEKPYSIAQHCVYVSLLVPEEYAMEALMHDAGEAFLGDVSSPLKQLLADYKKLEQSVEASIFKKYGLQFPMHPEIKKADMRMFVSERIDLQPNCSVRGYNFERAPFKVVPWGHKKAYEQFLKRFDELGGVIK